MGPPQGGESRLPGQGGRRPSVGPRSALDAAPSAQTLEGGSRGASQLRAAHALPAEHVDH